jgi:hypothetical protein
MIVPAPQLQPSVRLGSDDYAGTLVHRGSRSVPCLSCPGLTQRRPVDERRPSLGMGDGHLQQPRVVIAGLDPAIHGLHWTTTSLDRAVDARSSPGMTTGVPPDRLTSTGSAKPDKIGLGPGIHPPGGHWLQFGLPGQARQGQGNQAKRAKCTNCSRSSGWGAPRRRCRHAGCRRSSGWKRCGAYVGTPAAAVRPAGSAPAPMPARQLPRCVRLGALRRLCRHASCRGASGWERCGAYAGTPAAAVRPAGSAPASKPAPRLPPFVRLGALRRLWRRARAAAVCPAGRGTMTMPARR